MAAILGDFNAKRSQFYLSLLFVYLVAALALSAQDNSHDILALPISLEKESHTQKELLQRITDEAGYDLSYNPAHLKTLPDTLYDQSYSLMQLIDALFIEGMRIRIIGNQLIIFKERPVKTTANDRLSTVSGYVKDGLTGIPIQKAEIQLESEDGIYTQTNSEGYFIIRFKRDLGAKKLYIKADDYLSREVEIDTALKVNIALEGNYIPLEEVIVLSVDPYDIVDKSLRAIRSNYLNKSFQATAFYREIVKKGKSPAGTIEAVFKLDKPSYGNSKHVVPVEMVKGRKFIDHQTYDTIQFKTKGSIKSCIDLDVVQNPPAFFYLPTVQHYRFSFKDVIYYDDELVYVIDFKKKDQKPGVPYMGSLYIAEKSFALKAVDFSIDPTEIGKLSSLFILKKPGKYVVKPKSARYFVKYRRAGERYVLSYTRLETVFKVRKRKALFSQEYASSAEMILNKIDTTASRTRIQRNNTFLTNRILFDQPISYDNEYWDSYNYLPLEKPLIEAIENIPDR